MPTGEQLKLAGTDMVARNNRPWVGRMRARALMIAIAKGKVSADDLRRVADEENDHPLHPNAWGVVFRPRCWEMVGRTNSTYPSNHRREIRVWRYVKQ